MSGEAEIDNAAFDAEHPIDFLRAFHVQEAVTGLPVVALIAATTGSASRTSVYLVDPRLAEEVEKPIARFALKLAQEPPKGQVRLDRFLDRRLNRPAERDVFALCSVGCTGLGQ
jgi:hypothetical protein